MWPPLRRQRFRRWLIEYRAHEDALMYRQFADERRERLASGAPELLASMNGIQGARPPRTGPSNACITARVTSSASGDLGLQTDHGPRV
ncbi:MAG TPA: hypothetical protein VIW24_21865 [Aldersonia sp.]